MDDNFSNSQTTRKVVIATKAGVVAAQHRRAADLGMGCVGPHERTNRGGESQLASQPRGCGLGAFVGAGQSGANLCGDTYGRATNPGVDLGADRL